MCQLLWINLVRSDHIHCSGFRVSSVIDWHSAMHSYIFFRLQRGNSCWLTQNSVFIYFVQASLGLVLWIDTASICQVTWIDTQRDAFIYSVHISIFQVLWTNTTLCIYIHCSGFNVSSVMDWRDRIYPCTLLKLRWFTETMTLILGNFQKLKAQLVQEDD